MLIPFISAIANDQLMQDKKMLMLVVTATGLIVVFLALIILICIFSIFGAVSKSKKKDATKNVPVAPPVPPKSVGAAAGAAKQLSAGGVSEEIIAAISAAVAVTMDGKPFAIRSVKRAAQSGRNAWSNAGIIANTRPF